jgi:hypothetical protein
MKTRSKLRSCALSGIFLLFAIPVLVWLGFFFWSANFGVRKDIIQIFPNAEIYTASSPNMGSGGIWQALMPEGYLLPGVRADVVVRGFGDEVSFEDLGNLNVSSLQVFNCKIKKWEELLLKEPQGMCIRITDSTFIGGDDESRRMLMRFRREDSATGEIYYFFGNAP